MEASGVTALAEPTLDAGESVADFLAADDGFDSDKAARARLRLRAPEPARHRAPRRLSLPARQTGPNGSDIGFGPPGRSPPAR